MKTAKETKDISVMFTYPDALSLCLIVLFMFPYSFTYHFLESRFIK